MTFAPAIDLSLSGLVWLAVVAGTAQPTVAAMLPSIVQSGEYGVADFASIPSADAGLASGVSVAFAYGSLPA